MFETTQETVAPQYDGSDSHVGAAEDFGGCDGCKIGATVAIGKRIIGITAGTIVPGVGVTPAPLTVVKISSVCTLTVECLFVPTGQAPNFVISSLKYQDIEMIAESSATVTGNGVADADAVPLTEFLAFGTCGNLLRGICMQQNTPMTLELANITPAVAELQIGIKGVKGRNSGN